MFYGCSLLQYMINALSVSSIGDITVEECHALSVEVVNECKA